MGSCVFACVAGRAPAVFAFDSLPATLPGAGRASLCALVAARFSPVLAVRAPGRAGQEDRAPSKRKTRSVARRFLMLIEPGFYQSSLRNGATLRRGSCAGGGVHSSATTIEDLLDNSFTR